MLDHRNKKFGTLGEVLTFSDKALQRQNDNESAYELRGLSVVATGQRSVTRGSGHSADFTENRTFLGRHYHAEERNAAAC